MGIGDPFRRLDDRVLPPIAKAFARLSRGARRLRIIRFVAVIISLTVVLVAVYAAGRQPAQTFPPPAPTIRLGVTDGDSIPLYIAGSKAKLSTLIAQSSSDAKPPMYFALVSMSAYLDPQHLATVFAGLNVQVISVIMRVKSPEQTEIFQIYATSLPSDVIRGMLAIADKKQREVADDIGLQANVTGPSLIDRTLLAQYKQETAIARLEEGQYRSLCSCVYAAVVHATPAVLGQLASRPNVRAVEPALHLTPDSAVFLPPFPDQHVTVEPPPSSAPSAPVT